MAIDPKHMLAVGGIAVVALGAGFGVARATGGKDAPPPARPAAKAELPSVAAGSPVQIARLEDVAALPARPARQPKRSGKSSRPADNPGPSRTPSATAAPNPTAAPPVATSAPVTPTSAPSTPEPVRTPAVGGGTGGEP
jgi:hypothetical protein